MKSMPRMLTVRQMCLLIAIVSAQGTQAQVPMFQVDPSWPKIPSKWVFAEVSDVNVDEQKNHVWVIHRPGTFTPEKKGRVGPPVFEFDTAGNFIQAWGGPGKGYEWPGTEHGVYVDYKNFVWIAGSGAQDDQILKFTRTGKFVMQIGHSGKSTGNTDTKNVKAPADVFVYPKTNEVFVADGYGNHRVIVFDADTGAFKRMWGAFGNRPTDDPPASPTEDGPGPPQFGIIHCARVSNDGLVYVCDRSNNRFQVFTTDGKYVTQVFLGRDKASREKWARQDIERRGTEMAFGKPLTLLYQYLENGAQHAGQSVSSVAFSPDPEQKFLYVTDRPRQEVAIFDRKTLKLLGSFGGVGDTPGHFYILHNLAVDKQGDIYTAEHFNVDGNDGGRAQKFTFKGLSSAPEK